jgi:dTDP-4-dehydrorhamnose 3,5-epimerase
MAPLQVKAHHHIVARPGEAFTALGAVWSPLEKHADSRGWFSEIWKEDRPDRLRPRQVSLSETGPGVTKAFHFHSQQEDLFVPLSGHFRIVLLTMKAPCAGFSIWWEPGAEGALRIPAGLAHGYRVETSQPGRMLYLTSETYSPEDEGRLACDGDVEGFPWGEGRPPSSS